MQLDFTPRQAFNVGRMQLGAIDGGELDGTNRTKKETSTNTSYRHLPS